MFWKETNPTRKLLRFSSITFLTPITHPVNRGFETSSTNKPKLLVPDYKMQSKCSLLSAFNAQANLKILIGPSLTDLKP